MRSIQESLITRLKIPTREGNKVIIRRCNNCGTTRNPPRTYCNRCQGTSFTELKFGPKGVITTFSSSYKRKATDKQRFFGNVRLFSDNGEDSTGLSGTFDVENLDALEIGQKVELLPDEKYNIFKLVDD